MDMMKYLIFVFLFVQQAYGQNTFSNRPAVIRIGDVFKIGDTENSDYKYIKFPKKNFIIKKGGVADYETVIGRKVIITSVKVNRFGKTKVKIRPQDGRRFFTRYLTVGVDFDSAIKSGELVRCY
jgi:hypothetical protein